MDQQVVVAGTVLDASVHTTAIFGFLQQFRGHVPQEVLENVWGHVQSITADAELRRAMVHKACELVELQNKALTVENATVTAKYDSLLTLSGAMHDELVKVRREYKALESALKTLDTVIEERQELRNELDVKNAIIVNQHATIQSKHQVVEQVLANQAVLEAVTPAIVDKCSRQDAYRFLKHWVRPPWLKDPVDFPEFNENMTRMALVYHPDHSSRKIDLLPQDIQARWRAVCRAVINAITGLINSQDAKKRKNAP